MIETDYKVQLLKIKEYYTHCWLKRFEQGHNPVSLAMHMGYFDNGIVNNDEAKLNLNKYLITSLAADKYAHLKIADLGCGFGGTCIYLASNLPNAHITGVNFASDQIAFAENKVNELGLREQISFLEEDYAATSLPSNHFDFAFAIESFCHALDKEEFLTEAKRILKPGGMLVILDYRVMYEPQTANDKNLLKIFEEGWAVLHYIFRPEEMLEKIAFEDAEIKNISSNIQPGIELSNSKAIKILQHLEETDEIFKKHLNACVALKELFDKKLIQYFKIKAVKGTL